MRGLVDALMVSEVKPFGSVPASEYLLPTHVAVSLIKCTNMSERASRQTEPLLQTASR